MYRYRDICCNWDDFGSRVVEVVDFLDTIVVVGYLASALASDPKGVDSSNITGVVGIVLALLISWGVR